MSICSYTTTYYDWQTHPASWKPHRCDEHILKGSLCPFHDKSTDVWDDMTQTKFQKKLDQCTNASKPEPLKCIGYRFPINFIFENLHFYDEVDFSGAEFFGQVDFSKSTFYKSCNFTNTIFHKEVIFRNVSFLDPFYPRNTRFLNNVNFRRARFTNAYFHDTFFNDKANFRDAIFKGKTLFRDVQFMHRANFSDTIFSGSTIFLGSFFEAAKFSKDVRFDGPTYFRYVVFEKGEKVIYESPDLSKVSFLDTDISRIAFSENVKWGKGKNDYKVFDERRLEKTLRYVEALNKFGLFSGQVRGTLTKMAKDPYLDLSHQIFGDKLQKILAYTKGEILFDSIIFSDRDNKYKLIPVGKVAYDLSDVKAIYRNLRENYEFRLRYEDAGKFFIREMELKRNYTESDDENEISKTNKIIRNLSFTGLYYNLFRYGESFKQPTFAVVLPFLIICTSYWFLTEMWVSSALPLDALSKSFTNTISTLLHIKQDNMGLIDSMIHVFSLGILGMYFIPLRRKFERKFRH